ncbi:hypothetical protein THER_1669 [Thermodesulfovibrio sp. N1]|uniref:hypothetical protein n=1 Tax=unclassified Thermodesulfovibrio TaxID=2645936 RepID=UPI00083B1F63|nr:MULTISPECIES: hypothetical protein [unclassified Thermodesulfovibrio]MDI1471905.1 hypothetical protein [Thermodesulfovibrio sp. 1176]ODA43630.1 hypothetical protein THER_1669 [Thermodesulfovibrio sp. N1]
MKKKGQATDERQKIWKVIRGLLTFTIDDIVRLTGCNERNAYYYICKLNKAGYFRVIDKQATKTKHRRVYRLIKNTGPLAPIETSVIFDPNIKEVMINERDTARGNTKKR